MTSRPAQVGTAALTDMTCCSTDMTCCSTDMTCCSTDIKTCAEMGDRSSLSLLGGQPELLQRVSRVARKTVVVLIGGRPLTFQ
eukprot:COSAG01_NODE_22207_length_867_cov_0.690104_2_plen_82_part_01